MEENNIRKFVIIGWGRTRSTLLSSLLNNHPHIACEEEIFLEQFFMESKLDYLMKLTGKTNKDNSLLQELYDYRKRDPVGFMEYFYSILARDKNFVGFKLFPEQNEKILEHVLKNKEIKKIILVRNFLFSHVSVQQSLHSRKWFAKQGEKSEQDMITFQFKTFLGYLKRRVNALHRILNELQDSDQNYFLCFSEDIGKEDWRKEIYDFLGVGLNIKTETNLVKQNPDYLQERVSNYEQMVRQLMYTDYNYLLYGDFFPDRNNWLPDRIPESLDPAEYASDDFHKEVEKGQGLIELQKNYAELEKKVSAMESSVSYRLGYGLTRIPAAILSLFNHRK